MSFLWISPIAIMLAAPTILWRAEAVSICIHRSNETNNGGLAPTQTPNVPNHSDNNFTVYGSDNSQTSNNIALGTGIGIGIPGVILTFSRKTSQFCAECLSAVERDIFNSQPLHRASQPNLSENDPAPLFLWILNSLVRSALPTLKNMISSQ